ncbi:hypothetical protein [Leifsonia sp. A12D58]|uniref:hypothetical protein n=1 Tax=Leifsonia sp. A12D58 TaxID=3397674 RepID=UPI0039DF66BC
MTGRIDDAMQRSLTAMGLATVTLLLLSGCGNAPGGPSGSVRSVPMAEVVAAADCLAPNLGDGLYSEPVLPGQTAPAPEEEDAHADAPPAGRVPAGFEAVAAIRCNLHGSVDDAEGRWAAVTAETRGGNLARLLSALAEADDGSSIFPCTADMELMPPLWLVDASGQAIHVHYPRNACGKTKSGAREAFEALDVVASVTLKRNLIEPRAAIDAGCAVQWTAPSAGWPALTTPGPPVMTEDGLATIPLEAATAGPVVPTIALRWCRYATEPLAPDTSPAPVAFEGAIMLRTGTFVAGGVLDSALTARVYVEAAAAVAESGGARCDAAAESFMVLWPADGGAELSWNSETSLSVDLDGCPKLYRAGADPRPISAELLGLLASASE